MSTRTRVVIADDNPAMRAAVRIILERAHCEVVGEAADGLEAARVAAALRPDLVVLDHSMPISGGFDAARRMAAWPNPPTMIMLSLDLAPHHLHLGVRLGIRGFVRKADVVEELAAAVGRVLDGDRFFGAGAADALIELIEIVG